MDAILWDGFKQISGKLEITEMEIVFRMNDFSDTSLHLAIPFGEIAGIARCKLYGIASDCIEILSLGGKRNVFVVEDVEGLKNRLIKCLKREK